MRGSLATRKTMEQITALGILAISFALVLTATDPASSPEATALKVANMVAADLTALSAQHVDGDIAIGKDSEFDLDIVFYKNTWGIEWARHAYRWATGKPAFGRTGYYVVVTPYKRGKLAGSQAAFILAYPKEPDKKLEISLKKTKNVCITKAGEALAQVIPC